ncbi:MAG: FUSC family membrane protein [Alcaligenaceae bacterium]|nr:FUSC family membrane protein [Alcaligenaceae bacterium]
MHIGTDTLNKFFHSPELYFGVRKAFGLFVAIFVFFGLLQDYEHGVAFASGVLCMSIVDPPAAYSLRARSNELLATLMLCSVGTFFVNLLGPYHEVSWVMITALVFLYSILAVYGKSGTLIGFAALLAILMNHNFVKPYDEAMVHSALTFLGCTSYWFFSVSISYLFRKYEQRLIIASALYATANYMLARARLYDVERDLDKSFHKLINQTSRMIETQQAARDMILRHLPSSDESSTYEQRTRLWNIFNRMVAIMDNMVATHTDYQYLRKKLSDHDALLFMRDTLVILSATLNHAATDLIRNEPLSYRSSVKAELRALEFEIEQFRAHNLPQEEPEIYSLVIQIYRRLRNTHFNVEEISNNLRYVKNFQGPPDPRQSGHECVASAKEAVTISPSLLQFRSTNDYSFSRLLNQLKMGLKSAIVRYSLRVTAAVLFVQLGTALLFLMPLEDSVYQNLSNHTNWILVTVLLIMRPGFTLTQQRTSWRLIGTLIGCIITIGLFAITNNNFVIMTVMFVAMILGNTYIKDNFRLGSVFITVYILIGFHFLTPGFYWLVGERALDTLIASAITFVFSFLLPWWERDQLPKYVSNTIDALYHYLHDTIAYVRVLQALPKEQRIAEPTEPSLLAMHLSRKKMQDAYALFTDSLNRMMSEPDRRQMDIIRLNRILLEADALASQINSMVPLMIQFDDIPEDLEKNIDYVYNMLTLKPFHCQDEPPPIESGQDYISMRFPLKQMYKASQVLKQEATALGLN